MPESTPDDMPHLTDFLAGYCKPKAEPHYPGVSDDPASATAEILSLLRSDCALYEAVPALQALTTQNHALVTGGDAAIADSLTRQIALLEAMFHRYVILTEHAKSANDKNLMNRMAIRTHRAMLSTLGALRQTQQAVPILLAA